MSGTRKSSNGVDFVDTRYNDTYPYISPTKANLSGCSVLITGASRGVGQALAVSYAQAGASKIALAARSSQESTAKSILAAAKKAGHAAPQVIQVKLDVTDEANVEAARRQLESELGSLDVLVNNAGYMEDWKTLDVSDVTEWWKTWEVNVKGVYLMTRAFVPLLQKSKLKTIINVTSNGAHFVYPSASAYQMTKMAVCRLTEFTDVEFGPAVHGENGIVTIGVHPGGVKTELASTLPEPMHAMLTEEPELPADAIVWLTKERRDWLSGRYVDLRWDMQELEKKKEEIVKGRLLKFTMDFNASPKKQKL